MEVAGDTIWRNYMGQIEKKPKLVQPEQCLHLSFEGGVIGNVTNGRRQNSLFQTTNFSQKFTQPSEGISCSVGDLWRHFTKLTPPIDYIVI